MHRNDDILSQGVVISHVSKINLIIDDISDHRPILITINANKQPIDISSNNLYIRDMTNFDIQGFNDSLFNFQTNSANINKKFSQLQTHILECIEKHVPLRKRTRKEREFSSKPWISNSIKQSIDNKNKLYLYLQSHSNDELKRKYNKMRKILKKKSFLLLNVITMITGSNNANSTLGKHGVLSMK